MHASHFAEYMQSSATIASSSLPQSETDPSLKRSQMPLKAVYQGSVVGVRYRCPAHPSFSPEHTFYRRFQLMFKSEAEAQRFVDLIENVCPIGPAAKSTRNAKGKGQGAAVGTFEAKVDPNACKPASKLPAAQPTLRASCVRAPDPFEDTHPRPQPSKLPLAVSALLALSSASNGSVAQGTVAISNALSSHGALLAGEQAHTCEQQTATGPPAEPSPPSASAVRNSSPAARRQQHTEGSMKGVQSQLIDAKSTTKAHFLTQADSLEAPPTAKKRKCAPKKKASVGVQTDLSSVEMELMLIPADGAHAHIEEAAPCTVMDYIQQGDFTPFLSLPDEQLVALLQDFTDFSPTFRALCCRLQALSAR
ncbi:hypothetical protein K437DRAFT_258949 [Tilletiaria anomala UBC 951]|uniref:Uncharacterized protein n=1 Tax=Tilletiaria anomala (strain ATCC 24038 / CBS 436.72 / UBC 951) TaxID=1037660 RepID=A0A066VH94_TILAU|nr:uncharacterized protein K437DRAFT_258949 [Tilletiaria anomala UBC 951]KDN39678.1 hypothetical protein K437DRAFT_258949 [Tilletiaria anomala UBC 951]